MTYSSTLQQSDDMKDYEMRIAKSADPPIDYSSCVVIEPLKLINEPERAS